MIKLDEIESEILQLEKKDTSYAVVERLAWLYICRDHLHYEQSPTQKDISHVRNSSTPFLVAVSGKPVEDVFDVIDEHMTAVGALFPKEYEAVVRRINKL